ncbi:MULTISPECIES: VOC family protein [Shewanella]|uniref:VOC family protein n=1 Tax=Shewanella algae TaxID=38313 RepID=UPI000D1230AF|nr:VOC family protein [Shewanella algae]MBO2556413.1 VOC family protein [Shewanella algae]MBO2573347.1 VOC family protein [Shewanella algae]MBO2586393.1 VOC family protein [Shewanella algae]MBO2611773.1 VOC family protein [Shewanella algae]MCE9773703.1 VOC family protein [Shewanella algae]
MKVKRIVANVAAADLDAGQVFYESIFGLELVMDHGWIKTLGSAEEMKIQISLATEGGSGTPVPDLSIEVDNLDLVLHRLRAQNIKIEYGPISEPWGVRRFYIRDPFGKLLNVLQHDPDILLTSN